MTPGRILIGIGFLLILAGVAWEFGGRYLRLGRLPGDIAIHRGNMHFYFPVMTSLLLSALLTFVFWLLGKIR